VIVVAVPCTFDCALPAAYTTVVPGVAAFVTPPKSAACPMSKQNARSTVRRVFFGFLVMLFSMYKRTKHPGGVAPRLVLATYCYYIRLERDVRAVLPGRKDTK
jgi:hypothetical protein